MLTMRQQFADWYLDYVNNWLTLDGFAEYYGISPEQAAQVIAMGKVFHEEDSVTDVLFDVVMSFATVPTGNDEENF